MPSASKLPVLFQFYKTTCQVNFCLSACMAILAFHSFNDMFLLCWGTGGSLLSLLYKELLHQNTYVFYQNLSVTKLQLWLFTIAVNLSIVVIIYSLFCL
jgi:hypothetical protein